MKIIETKEALEELLRERKGSRPSQKLKEIVSSIIKSVMKEGDAAICEYTKQFDKCELSPSKLKVSKKSIGIAFLTFMNLVCFVSANKYTTAANAIVLQYTAPVFVLIVTAFILKRKLRSFEVITVFAALFGIVLFFMDQVSGNGLFGNILAVTSGFFMGIMYALTGEIKDDGERISGLVLGPAQGGGVIAGIQQADEGGPLSGVKGLRLPQDILVFPGDEARLEAQLAQLAAAGAGIQVVAGEGQTVQGLAAAHVQGADAGLEEYTSAGK